MSYSKKWYELVCKCSELQLKGTLNGGQSFRWKLESNDDCKVDVWSGVFSDCVWRLKQNDNCILYQVYDSTNISDSDKENEKELNGKANDLKIYDYLKKPEECECLLRNYFRLDLNLEEYYSKWSDADPFFKEAAKDFYGIRILSQDLVENIFSFICSSNNNITRISSMVEKLCLFYGNKICELNGVIYHTFPSVKSLAQSGVEQKLRVAGFGYRAGYIAKSANMIMEMGGDEWLERLKSMKYPDAKLELMKLTGIGAKVADCICLMSLGHLQSIPIDTHVYQIAARNYLKHLGKQKTVTEKVYNEIGDYFRNLYGPLAGWAHTVLFCADLKIFKPLYEVPTKRKKK